MKMKKVIALILALACTFSLLTSCGGSSSSTTASPSGAVSSAPTEATVTPRVLKFDSTYSTAIYEDADGIGTASPEKYFMDKFSEVTGGRYTVKTYLDNTLASNMTERMGGIKSGAFELASPALGNWGEYTDAFAEFNVPYLFKSLDVVEKFLDSDVAESMKAKVEADCGVKCLWWGIVGFREISTNKALIKTPADVKGLKIRVMSDPIQVASFEALGANVTNVSFSELFTAMQQKLIDAQDNPLNNVYNNKFYEVQNYITMTNHSFTASMYIMSMDLWNSMSAEDQAAINDLCKEMNAVAIDAIRDSDAKLISMLEDSGIEFYYPTDDELSQFQDLMKEKVYPQCEEIMGTDRWNKLIKCVSDIEAELGV